MGTFRSKDVPYAETSEEVGADDMSEGWNGSLFGDVEEGKAKWKQRTAVECIWIS